MFGFGMTEIMILLMLAILGAVINFVMKLVKPRNIDMTNLPSGSKFCSKCGTKVYVADKCCSGCGLEPSFFGASEQEEKVMMVRRGVALVEIIGGILGVVTAFGYVNSSAGFGVVICLVFVGLYGYSTVAGYWLWHNYAKGYHASIILQLLQIPVLVSPLLTYEFVSGLMMRFLVGIGGFDASFHFGSQFSFALLPQYGGLSVGVNCVPIVVFYLLRRIAPVK